MVDFMDTIMADEYLARRYKAPAREDFPLPDEDFTSVWRGWIEGRGDAFPGDVRALLRGAKVWLEDTPAGRIPVVSTEDRRTFERLTAIFSMEDEGRALLASVNALTVPAKHPMFAGHRVIFLAKGGYSALRAEDAGETEDEWVRKSAVIRLNHECCHYFTLRVLGGMKNHALDEVIADCAGQLSAFGRYDASLQRKFFGLDGDRVASGGRLGYYVRKLPEGAIPTVCRKVSEALTGLEGYLEKNAEMTRIPRRPDLIIKLATIGLGGIAELA
ncbi:MAG: hypothetical protein LBS45_11500 [Synergistaceae bacterium]|jgi:hypothetical protein|nr:hypothetical protein [Synergistaceae bacterium]